MELLIVLGLTQECRTFLRPDVAFELFLLFFMSERDAIWDECEFFFELLSSFAEIDKFDGLEFWG